MLAMGFGMVGLGLASLLLRIRGRLYDSPWVKRAAVLMGPAGLIAVLCGWIVTEVGRQPYTVYGLLRTADSASPLGAPAVGASLAAFMVVYMLVFGAGTFYLLRMMGKTPSSGDQGPDALLPTRAAAMSMNPELLRARGGSGSGNTGASS